MYTDVSGISFSLAGGGLPGSSVSTEQLNAALSRKSTTTARRETSVQSAGLRVRETVSHFRRQRRGIVLMCCERAANGT